MNHEISDNEFINAQVICFKLLLFIVGYMFENGAMFPEKTSMDFHHKCKKNIETTGGEGFEAEIRAFHKWHQYGYINHSV
jgi:hypothetical protein